MIENFHIRNVSGRVLLISKSLELCGVGELPVAQNPGRRAFGEREFQGFGDAGRDDGEVYFWFFLIGLLGPFQTSRPIWWLRRSFEAPNPIHLSYVYFPEVTA